MRKSRFTESQIVGILQEARRLSDAWLVTYNEHRPHDALGRVPPLTYLPRVPPPPGVQLCVVHLTGEPSGSRGAPPIPLRSAASWDCASTKQRPSIRRSRGRAA